MARKSHSSSAPNSNGHIHPPSDRDNPDEGSSSNANPDSSSERLSHESNWHSPGHTAQAQNLPYDPSLLPDGRRSLSSIAFQAFGLGFTLAVCLIATTHCIIRDNNAIWRLPAFFACLSAFHFLEFWTTAKYNMPAARASSFLLRNGKAYTIAHLLATIEIVVSYWFPAYQFFLVGWPTISIGAAVVLLGQLLRSFAMAEAGTNFNHTPAKMKKEGHVLVTAGVYTYLRHPSYCAFFWWAVGTQILVGNKVSLFGFAFVLWNFFKRRIRAEEVTLVQFFGMDYEEYRKRTITGIPFVR